jgi:hypothetical protein
MKRNRAEEEKFAATAAMYFMLVRSGFRPVSRTGPFATFCEQSVTKCYQAPRQVPQAGAHLAWGVAIAA